MLVQLKTFSIIFGLELHQEVNRLSKFFQKLFAQPKILFTFQNLKFFSKLIGVHPTQNTLLKNSLLPPGSIRSKLFEIVLPHWPLKVFSSKVFGQEPAVHSKSFQIFSKFFHKADWGTPNSEHFVRIRVSPEIPRKFSKSFCLTGT